MKVFLTGATGYVGSLVAQELIAHGHTVSGLARNDTSAQKLLATGITPVHGDLHDHSTLTQAARDADAIIHCAFIHDFDSPTHDLDKNMRADLDALKALAEGIRGTEKILVHTNESLATDDGVVLTERTKKATWWERKMSEDLFEQLAEEGLNVRTVRLPCVTHGTGDHHGFITALVEFAKKSGFAPYVGEGGQHWPSVNKLDAAVMYRLAIEKDLPKGQNLHPYEDEVFTIGEIARFIGEKLGVEAKSITQEEAVKELGFIGRCMGIDNQVVKEETVRLTGWKPIHSSLREDIRKVY